MPRTRVAASRCHLMMRCGRRRICHASGGDYFAERLSRAAFNGIGRRQARCQCAAYFRRRGTILLEAGIETSGESALNIKSITAAVARR